MKPEDRILAYLFAHQASLQYTGATVDSIVKDVKLFVFYGMSPISDDAIRQIVVQWGTFHAVGLLLKPSTAGGAAAGRSGRAADKFRQRADRCSQTRDLDDQRRSHHRAKRRQRQDWSDGADGESEERRRFGFARNLVGRHAEA